MPEYMLLLYATEVDEAERAERWAEMPLWDEVNASLREAGVLVKNREHFDYDPVRQVLFVGMEFEPVGDPASAWMTPLAHRQFFPQEWEALLHYNGLRVVRVEGDFQGGPLTRESDVMIWHCARA